MGQEMGKGDDITTMLLLQQLLPACLVLLVKPLCYIKGPMYPLTCSSEARCILTSLQEVFCPLLPGVNCPSESCKSLDEP
jgi:hypothetical protein